jgi:hypothetical protein
MVVFQRLITGETAIARGDASKNMLGNVIQENIDLPIDAKNLGVSVDQASKEYRDLIYKMLKINPEEVDKVRSQGNQTSSTFKTNLPHTYLQIGRTGMGSDKLYEFLKVTEQKQSS